MSELRARIREFSRLLKAFAGGCSVALLAASTETTSGVIAATLIAILTIRVVYVEQRVAVWRIDHARSISSREGVK